MTQIDWREAPEGASHFCNGDWFKKEDGKWCYWFDGARSWTEAAYADPSNFSWWGARIERPTTPQWNGEGLPPVGVECEYQRNDVIYKQAWVAVTPRYIGEPVTVLKHSASGNEFTEMTASCVFRPIRTPEQIAADEREAAIKEMAETVKSQFSFGWVFEKIYDAGYRKP